jgi:hypothetical protein
MGKTVEAIFMELETDLFHAFNNAWKKLESNNHKVIPSFVVDVIFDDLVAKRYIRTSKVHGLRINIADTADKLAYFLSYANAVAPAGNPMTEILVINDPLGKPPTAADTDESLSDFSVN